MPVIDMPMEKLATYSGRNPRPADFDAYWSQALGEMKAVKPDVVLRPAEFHAPHVDCFDMYFTGVGGARIHVKFLQPKHRAIDTKLPAICMFHGYSGHAGDWTEKLAWAGAGYIVAAMDCRGQGGYSEDITPVRGTTHRGHIVRGLSDPDPQKLLFRSIYLDTAELADILLAMPQVDATRVYAMGGSQGGGLTLACAALEPRIAKAAPQYPFLCDYQRVWEMDLAKDAYLELQIFFRQHDPRHLREQEIFSRLGYIDCQHLAPRIKARTLMAIGLMDTICPPSTQFAAYNKMTCEKRTAIYPDFAHEVLPGWYDLVFDFFTNQ
ncbi:MAG: acetylxylan esterase [Phycisphaerae bacterium]